MGYTNYFKLGYDEGYLNGFKNKWKKYNLPKLIWLFLKDVNKKYINGYDIGYKQGGMARKKVISIISLNKENLSKNEIKNKLQQFIGEIKTKKDYDSLLNDLILSTYPSVDSDLGKIKSKIAKDATKEVLNDCIKYFEGKHENNNYNQLILLSSKFNLITRAQRTGVLSNNQFLSEKLKLKME